MNYEERNKQPESLDWTQKWILGDADALAIARTETAGLMQHDRERLYRIMYGESSNLKALVNCKDYARPLGFFEPEIYTVSAYMGAEMVHSRKSPESDVTVASVFAASTTLIRYQMPTYFVSAQLCEALLKTEAPEDLLFSEIKMPMPAMLFMLPEDFTKAYFGFPVPYMTAMVVEPNTILKSPLKYKGGSLPWVPVQNDNSFFLWTALALEDWFPMHYDGRCPLWRPVKDLIHDVPFAEYGTLASVSESQKEKDVRTSTRATNLVVNILLAMTMETELVTRERMLRPARIKGKEVLRRALWKPNFIGERFRIQYEKAGMPEGTHHSPHAHWRRGHWRNQRHGVQNTLVKRIWIQPVFIGLDSRHQG